MIRPIIDRVFDTTFGYRYLRGLFHFGVRMGPIRRALALAPGDRVLDVGCGTGDYSPLVDDERCSYVGLDFSEDYIRKAEKLYGAPWRQFRVGDIRTMDYGPGSFSKALLLGVMHHLTDDENVELLARISRIVTDRLVIMDLSPGGWHVVNTMLCRLDRGRYPRRLGAQCDLVNRVMDVEHVSEYFVRSGVQRYSLIVARPRPVASSGVR